MNYKLILTKLTYLLTVCTLALATMARAQCNEGCLGDYNTVLGETALSQNTTGNNNTAIGSGSLLSNHTGLDNTAVGSFCLYYSGTGNNNTAVGQATMESNGGDDNTAIGRAAMFFNGTGSRNTVAGSGAMGINTTGNNNTALGASALINNTTGDTNIAIGFSAGQNLTTGSNNIVIANAGVTGESKAIRIGTRTTHRATYIAGISGATVAGGVGVLVDASGHLGTVTSSACYKDNIKPMDNKSEAILSLKPVTFRYKKALDPRAIPHFGLVAEDVAKVDPDLVARDDEGKPYTVRYEAVNAMLLNEFLKEHRKVEQLTKDFESRIADQQKQIEALTAMVREQAAQLQKVSAEVRASKGGPKVVANN